MRNTKEDQTHAPDQDMPSIFYGNTAQMQSPNMSQRSLQGLKENEFSPALTKTEQKVLKAELDLLGDSVAVDMGQSGPEPASQQHSMN